MRMSTSLRALSAVGADTQLGSLDDLESLRESASSRPADRPHAGEHVREGTKGARESADQDGAHQKSKNPDILLPGRVRGPRPCRRAVGRKRGPLSLSLYSYL